MENSFRDFEYIEMVRVFLGLDLSKGLVESIMLANSSKKLALKFLIEFHNPSIIFLQELMTYG